MENNFGIDKNKRYTASQTAEFLNVSVETIRLYARKNLIGFFKFGKRGDYYFSGTDIIIFLKKHYHPADNTYNIQ